mmetsp:Transcript_19541/g.28109  ORF Transcript_19541/g.28109 Transcript_19541/m.28109 type:complete len:94 (+) Transcript_19541:88-369(+)
MIDLLQEIGRRHQRLKEKIHSTRIPLSPAGQKFMGFVYFCIPVLIGGCLWNWQSSISERNLQERLQQQNVDVYPGTQEQNKAFQKVLDKTQPK